MHGMITFVRKQRLAKAVMGKCVKHHLGLGADYTFGHQKFGGNAQAITKQRWLHHTSLLWDFDPDNMALLKHPQRVPDYRAVGRSS